MHAQIRIELRDVDGGVNGGDAGDRAAATDQVFDAVLGRIVLGVLGAGALGLDVLSFQRDVVVVL